MRKKDSIRDQVLAAISRLNRRVAIPDVVAATGLPLYDVSTALNDLAFELKANLDVTDKGIIYYRFPADLHYRYYSNRLIEILRRVWIASAPVLSKLFRISFGLILLFSISLVFFIMLVLQSLMTVFSGNTNEVLNLLKEFGRLIQRLGLVNFSKLRFWRKEPEVEEPASDDKGFLLNCYSLLFGPENPNRNFDQEKSQAVAQLIRANDGLVLPEQLAPLTGASADDLNGAFPILAMFHGVPAATSTGHLVYKFPEMQGVPIDTTQAPPASMKLQPLSFADIGMDSMKPILMLAASNFMGTVFFWWLLFAVRSSESNTENFFLVLAIYASFFLFFPMFRWLYVQLKNREIKRYNQKIEELEHQLLEPSSELTVALSDAARLRQEDLKLLGSDHLVYTTSRDYLEQEVEKLEEADASSS